MQAYHTALYSKKKKRTKMQLIIQHISHIVPLLGAIQTHFRQLTHPNPGTTSAYSPSIHLVPLDPDIRGTVSTGIAHLVSKGGTAGLHSEIDAEVGIDLHSSTYCVHVNLEHQAALAEKLK